VRYDYLVVGAGLFGAVFARELTNAGRRVLVIDQRDHIGGNVFTRSMEGIQVHVYGPHIFHTDNAEIWEYVNRFATFNHYVHRPHVRYRDKVYSFPINLMTLHQLWGVNTPDEAERRLAEVRVPCERPANLEEWILAQVGEEIYRIFVYGYTKKQWGTEPRNLPPSIIRRLHIRLTLDSNYYTHRYQGIPIGGYTAMVERILDGVDVELATPFSSIGDWRLQANKLVFTGKLDEFFDYRYGDLEYRSLEFDTEVTTGDYQGVSQMNYTEETVPFTRIVEHKHFEFGGQHKTVITREYALKATRDTPPYYPINDARNNELYRKYKALADRSENVIFGGRLAAYRYYDMHQVIGSALAAARREFNRDDRAAVAGGQG
jgi:UDP-galactopyranose mutase